MAAIPGSRPFERFTAALRCARDLGFVVLVSVILWKLATEDRPESNGAGPAGGSLATTPLAQRTNSLGMVFLRVPPGEFVMGSSSYSFETLPHPVRLSRVFWLGRTEVTQAEYQQVMGATPAAFPGARHPVEQVSWEEALEFCRRLGTREGASYRLPTEAEWEYACRAGTRASFGFGDDDTRLGEYAWYDASACRQTQPVGTRKPNGWGFHDMHGNVWEWCADGYREDAYRSLPATDPVAEPIGPFRVMRGGCWGNRPLLCRTARRDFFEATDRSSGIGFRVVRVEP